MQLTRFVSMKDKSIGMIFTGMVVYVFVVGGFKWRVRINPTTTSISVSQHPDRVAGEESNGRAHQLEYTCYTLNVYRVYEDNPVKHIWRVPIQPVMLMLVYIYDYVKTGIRPMSVGEKVHFNMKAFPMLLGLVLHVPYFLQTLHDIFKSSTL